LELIQQYAVLLLVIGPNWATSAHSDKTFRLQDDDDVIWLEIEAAKDLTRPIMIACVDEASMPASEQLPPSIHFLVDIKPIVFGRQESVNRDINALIGALNRVLASTQQRASTKRYSALDPDETRQAVIRNFVEDYLGKGYSPLGRACTFTTKSEWRRW
jgi:hypothetical protein